LQRVAEAVQTVRAVSSGERGELHVGYAPSPTTRLLPQALRLFQEEAGGVRVVLHDFSTEEMLEGLRENELQLALLKRPPDKSLRGLTFEELDRFAVCVATNRAHRLARARQVGLYHLAGERFIGYTHAGYPEYHEWLASLFVRLAPPAIAEEHDSSLSLIAAVEAGRGVALIAQGLESLAGPRLKIRALNPAPAPVVVGVAHRKGKTTAVTGRFVAALRRTRSA
jgi:DNA-binding transcriptional LysR family regulator